MDGNVFANELHCVFGCVDDPGMATAGKDDCTLVCLTISVCPALGKRKEKRPLLTFQFARKESLVHDKLVFVPLATGLVEPEAVFYAHFVLRDPGYLAGD